MTAKPVSSDAPPSPHRVDDAPPRALAPVADELADDALTVEQIGSRIVGLAGQIAAATCRWLLLVAEFDRREGYAPFGVASTARWLSFHCGISARTAFDHVRVGHALATYPHLAAEMSAGRLSYSHVRAIARVAGPAAPSPAPPAARPSTLTAAPPPADGQVAASEPPATRDDDFVESLVDIAEHGTVGQLEDVVRGLRCVQRNEADDDARRAGLVCEPDDYLDTRFGHDSFWRIRARLAPELGTVVDAALTAVARAEEVDRATALYRLAEMALSTLIDTGRLPRALRGDEHTAVVIHLDARDVPADPAAVTDPDTTTDPDATSDPAAVTSDPDIASDPDADVTTTTDTGQTFRPRRRPFARLADGPGLPDAVVYRLLCDGRIRTLVHTADPDGTRHVVDAGRSHRLVTDAQYRALVTRDGDRCATPGCRSRRRLHAHHIGHWLHGGPTLPENLVVICEVHHRKIHDGEITVRAVAPGRFDFRRADGRSLLAHPDPLSLTAAADVESTHADLAPDAATTRWDGTRLDRHYAISCLAAARARRERQAGHERAPA